jgi:putative transposase
MANTYTQIHLQVIFAVKKRTGLIQKEWKPARMTRSDGDELYKYITGIIQTQDHKLLAINVPTAIHNYR